MSVIRNKMDALDYPSYPIHWVGSSSPIGPFPITDNYISQPFLEMLMHESHFIKVQEFRWIDDNTVVFEWHTPRHANYSAKYYRRCASDGTVL